MPEFDPRFALAAIGAALTVGSAMIAGLRLERWAVRHAPALAPGQGALVVAGLLVGLACVAQWLI